MRKRYEWLSYINKEWEDLDSGDESEEGDDGPQSSGKFPTFRMPKSMVNFKWDLWTYFRDKEAFKDAIGTYVVHSKRNLKILKNDNRKVRIKCKRSMKSVVVCIFWPFTIDQMLTIKEN